MSPHGRPKGASPEGAPVGRARHLASCAAVLLLAGCGGGGPLDNPPLVDNPAGTSSQKLSFAYYQKCINPIFLAALQTTINGVVSTNTCAGAGCHANATGTGGAFRVIPEAAAVTLPTPPVTPDAAAVRATDMYKNFYSAQGEVVLSAPAQSRLLAKPQLLNVLHGGGLIFESAADPNLKLIQFWITHPQPQGQDEFSTTNNSVLFTSGACNTTP
jgi:hypothetical protein